MTTIEAVDASAHGRSRPLQDTGWVALGVLLGIVSCFGVVHAIMPFTMTDAFSLTSLTVFVMLAASVQDRRTRQPAFARHRPPRHIRRGLASPVTVSS